MIVATVLQDHHFLIRMVDKYHLKLTNIILNPKYFYQHNNNKTNCMETHHHKANTAPDNNNMAVQCKHQFKQVNSQAEVLELNSGDLKFNI